MDHNSHPVAYLSYDGLTDPLGQSQITPYLKGLSKLGHRFTVFSFEKQERFIALSEKIAIEMEEHNIRWHPLRYHKTPPVISTIYDLWILWRDLSIAHKKTNFKIVHCRSYISALVGLRAKRKFGMKFIFDMRGFWADERVEGGLWNLKNPLYKAVYKFFKVKEVQFLTQADHVISLTYNAKLEIETWGSKTAPVTVIPTCVDLDFFDPAKIKIESQEDLRQRLNLSKSDFVLLYLGSWGTWYMTDEMLRFFSELKKKVPLAKFLIVSPDTISLGQYVHRSDVVVTYSTRDLVPLHISIASLAIFFIKPSFSKKASSAAKLGELLAMNKPVITNRGWGDIQNMDFDSQVHLVGVEDPVSLDWIGTERHSSSSLVQLSLPHAIETYHSVYLGL